VLNILAGLVLAYVGFWVLFGLFHYAATLVGECQAARRHQTNRLRGKYQEQKIDYRRAAINFGAFVAFVVFGSIFALY